MNLTNIRSNSRFFALGNNADSSFSDADILACSNLNYHELVSMGIRADGSWTLLDKDKAQTSITAATRQYALPTMPLAIKRVEIKYPSTSDDYLAATPIAENSIPPSGLDDYVSLKPEYRLNGTKIEIFLPVKTEDIVAVTNGINIYWEDEVTELAAVGDVTIFPEFVNKLLCLMNARDYCGVNGLNTRLGWLEKQIGDEETGATSNFLKYLETRSEDKRARIEFRKENYGQSAN